MGSDGDINRSLLHACYYFLLLLWAAKSAQHLHLHRILSKTRGESFKMLLGQNRGWNKHSRLFPIHNRLEGGSHGDFRLSIPHVAADQPVHSPHFFHVHHHIFDSLELIFRLLVWKSGLEFALPRRITRESIAASRFASGIKLQQFLCQLPDRFFDLLLCFAPRSSAQLVDFHPHTVPADVLLHHAHLVGGDVERVSSSVADHEEILSAPLDFHGLDPAISTNAVRHVNHVIAHLEIQEAGYRYSFLELPAPFPASVPPEHLIVGDQSQLEIIRHKSLADSPDANRHMVDLSLHQHIAHPFRLLIVVAHDGNGVALADPVLHLFEEHGEIAAQSTEGSCFERKFLMLDIRY